MYWVSNKIRLLILSTSQKGEGRELAARMASER